MSTESFSVARANLSLPVVTLNFHNKKWDGDKGADLLGWLDSLEKNTIVLIEGLPDVEGDILSDILERIGGDESVILLACIAEVGYQILASNLDLPGMQKGEVIEFGRLATLPHLNY